LDPIFLETAEILRIHNDQIKRYGGIDGIRDDGLLDSAISTPKVTFGGEFLHKDLFEMAAAYLFHIVKDHPFLDGNKRTGSASAIVFLNLNGCQLNVDEESFESMVRSVAEGNLIKEQLAQLLRQNCTLI
jgi:death-on-curing protein